LGVDFQLHTQTNKRKAVEEVMNEAREEVSRYARGLTNPWTTVEVAMTRVERPGAEALDTDKEALSVIRYLQIPSLSKKLWLT
jgi:hypothetical protein